MGDPMIEILLQPGTTYLGLLLPGFGLVSFFAFKYISEKRDSAFRKEAETILDALDAERIRHIKRYSVHQEIERRNKFDESMQEESNSNVIRTG